MIKPVDKHESEKAVEREGEAQIPAAGRDMDRPRGGIKGILLGASILAALILIGFLAGLYG